MKIVDIKQLHHMQATIYTMSDGTQVLASYQTIVAMYIPMAPTFDGTIVSHYWTSPDATPTTKRHITTWLSDIWHERIGIADVRGYVMQHKIRTFDDIDTDYLDKIHLALCYPIGW